MLLPLAGLKCIMWKAGHSLVASQVPRPVVPGTLGTDPGGSLAHPGAGAEHVPESAGGRREPVGQQRRWGV